MKKLKIQIILLPLQILLRNFPMTNLDQVTNSFFLSKTNTSHPGFQKRGGAGNQPYERMTCQYCEKAGHTAKNC